MPRIKVIGVGPGNLDYLTPAAQRALASVRVLVGGQRHLSYLAREEQKTFVIKNNLAAMVDFIRLHREEGIAVLASGDPGLYGILNYLRLYFTPEELEVIPGISSVQLAFARLAMPWHDALILSAHGRPVEDLVNLVRNQGKVALLTGPGAAPNHIASLLLKAKIADRKVFCCCNLGYPEEKILETTPGELARRDFSGQNNCVMVIIDEKSLALCDSGDSR
ncbi:precorrin-6y C5,15-methyltransferase (decarboxylating) subunit CbiE [Desulfofundulus thermosubterraneus]|uniref:Precorrin-6Y C5,15-methyltransferase (Decarboxylating) n=1 Tax=Desulfofundulus thermosubterraneus DSM 16057 TaxID=1121432 RepID=A0A1M6DL28_9FIRM|nr:precorrin-6y C5,15-methyltransferase (decarboxylating) subunit CbiE [Desulfofundulus thermosubterraneus]SHI73861.1 precorrin-6Y C5,15-methyltransferase (decarboxylating) [Desulfofundulus thermosubterraneus DSM 16057]